MSCCCSVGAIAAVVRATHVASYCLVVCGLLRIESRAASRLYGGCDHNVLSATADMHPCLFMRAAAASLRSIWLLTGSCPSGDCSSRRRNELGNSPQTTPTQNPGCSLSDSRSQADHNRSLCTALVPTALLISVCIAVCYTSPTPRPTGAAFFAVSSDQPGEACQAKHSAR